MSPSELPTDRRDAITVILAAFAGHRGDVHAGLTLAQANLALRVLGVTREELLEATRAMGLSS